MPTEASGERAAPLLLLQPANAGAPAFSCAFWIRTLSCAGWLKPAFWRIDSARAASPVDCSLFSRQTLPATVPAAIATATLAWLASRFGCSSRLLGGRSRRNGRGRCPGWG